MKNSFYVFLLLILVALFVSGCKKSGGETEEPSALPSASPAPTERTPPPPTATPMPRDFGFILKYGVNGGNIINTFEGTVTLVLPSGPVTYDYAIPRDAMMWFHDLLLQYGVDKMPESLESTGGAVPVLDLVFTYTADGVTKTVEWLDTGVNEAADLPDDHLHFAQFIQKITDFVLERAEPPSD